MFMAAIFMLFGIIALVAAVVLLHFRRGALGKADLMRKTETSSATEVSRLTPGSLVEVKGTLRCDHPLTSEMTETECAYYSAAVLREYLREDQNDDDSISNRRTETLSRNEQFAPFRVEDAMGSVAVEAEGAEVDAKEVMDRFERFTGKEGPSISLGGATLHIGGRERTLGYRYKESILPVDAPVYVLGVVRENGAIGVTFPGPRGRASSSATAPRRRSKAASAATRGCWL